MRAFSELLNRLYFTQGNRAKAALIVDYLRSTPDPDRGWAIAAIGGTLDFDLFKRALIRDLVVERVDPVLFDLSYDYVGELSETVAHLWPSAAPVDAVLPSLSEIITRCRTSDKAALRATVAELLDKMDPPQRWAFLKLGTRSLRVGVSARFLKQILAEYGHKDIGEVEAVWHGVAPPYADLLGWLEGGAKPDTADRLTFHPVMLAHPLEPEDRARITPEDYLAEWKYDGIRVQLVATPHGTALFSRTGDEIGRSFPDLLARVTFHAILDGELLVMRDGAIDSFNALQQRLGRKTPALKLMRDYPVSLMIYDALSLEGRSLRDLPLTERRAALEEWFARTRPEGMILSEALAFTSFNELEAFYLQANQAQRQAIEGLMLKRRHSAYIPGRVRGEWFKWKREPRLVDAVMMYAQRGHGKRSSYYSDYTFGVWQGETLVPIGKAYSGFTDEELKQLDKWVRNHTTGRFGPVREVEKALVLEVAFDAAQRSTRHKSGVALRFPRIHRIRWDKPAAEADRLEQVEAFIQ